MKKSVIVLMVVLMLFGSFSVVFAAGIKEPPKATLENWKSLVDAEVKAAKFNTGVYIYDVKRDDTYAFNADAKIRSASIIKLFILNHLFTQVKNGQSKLSDVVIFDHNKAVDGGMLHKFSSGATLRLEDMALFMLGVSDNTATNLFIDYFGMDKINETIQAFGVKNTILGRKMLDSEARKAGRDNFTCAEDVGRLLTSFIKADPRILDMLSLQKNRNKLPSALGFEDADDLEPVLAHKTGELGGIEHDSGVFFYASDHPVVVVVLTENLPDVQTGFKYIGRIGKIVYDAFNAE